MGVVASWSAADVTANFATIEIDQDAIGTDDFVTIEQIEPDFKLRMGLGGGATRSQNKGIAYKVTVKVRQCASVNDKLAAVLLLDRKTSGGAGIAPFIVKDRNGNYKFFCTQAFIEGDSAWSAGAEEKDLDWVILCPNPEVFRGGH
jgi:hypothetical protein